MYFLKIFKSLVKGTSSILFNFCFEALTRRLMTDVQGVIGLEDSLSFCLRPFPVNMAAQFLQEWPSFDSTCFPGLIKTAQ